MNRRKRLILLVDQDGSFRQMLSMALQKTGAEIVEAGTLPEAFPILEKHAPEIVLADIPIPEKEALELIQKARVKLPQAKIIAMSGGGGASARTYLRKAQEMGADAVLPKPFSVRDLLAVLGTDF